MRDRANREDALVDEEAAPRRGRLWLFANRVAMVGLAVIVLRIGLNPHPDTDAFAYWNAWHAGLYAGHWPLAGAYIYSPAFAQFPLWPLAQLPFGWFVVILAAVQTFALVAVLRPVPALLLVALPWWPYAHYLNPVQGSLFSGNVDVLLGALAALAVRYPLVWVVLLLTKVTPGVGLLWFALRREWRPLGIAIGTTAVVAAVSFVIAPGLWFDWIAALRETGDPTYMAPLIPWPLAVRLPLAAILVAWGARTDRAWTVPLAAGLALPQLGYGSYAVMVVGVLAHSLRDVHLLDVRVGGRRGRLVPVDVERATSGQGVH